MKRCGACQQEKALDCFYVSRDPRTPSGFRVRSKCKACWERPSPRIAAIRADTHTSLCRRCNQRLPLDRFLPRRSMPAWNGVRTWCKDCESDARPRPTRAARRAEIAVIKAAPCMDCGGRFPPEAMDFDHRPGEVKSFTIGPVAALYRWERILAEIAKCDLVCACCHRLRTVARSRSKASRGYYKAIAELKTGPCSDCGRRMNPAAMDWDHVRGEKRFDLARGRSLFAALVEIQKCELVCACCHRVRTGRRLREKALGAGLPQTQATG